MNHLQLVTDETPVPRREPEALFLRPFWVVRHAATAPPAVVKLGSRRRAGKRCTAPGPRPAAEMYGPVLPPWKTDPTDIENYRSRVPAWALEEPRRPVRPAALRVLYTYVDLVPPDDDEVRLPRSRKRPVASPRAMLGGDSHETLTNQRMTPEERVEHQRDLESLAADGVAPGMPSDDRNCPTGPCPHIQCRHHLYIEASGKRLTLNFPGLHVDEIPETCSLRVARAAAARRQESNQPNGPAMSCADVGKFLNLTPEAIRKDERRALAKLRAAGILLK